MTASTDGFLIDKSGNSRIRPAAIVRLPRLLEPAGCVEVDGFRVGGFRLQSNQTGFRETNPDLTEQRPARALPLRCRQNIELMQVDDTAIRCRSKRHSEDFIAGIGDHKLRLGSDRRFFSAAIECQSVVMALTLSIP